MMDNTENWKGKIEEINDLEDVHVNKEDDTPSSETILNHLPLTTSEFVQQTSQFSFQFLRQGLETIDKSLDFREQLLQYNLTTSTLNNLQFFSYRFHGLFNPQLMSDYEILLKEFFQQSDIRQTLGIIGDPDAPMKIQHSPIGLNTLAMDFFDRLYQSAVITPDGRIRGCFDETFDGLTVGDLLREMLVNENSENRYLFKESERQELIYHLFQTFVIGGSLCQPETNIDRYLAITKGIYKELVTVYKDADTKEVRVSGKAFEITDIKGTELFSGRINPVYSHFYVIIEPMKKSITIMKNTFNEFW